MAGPYDVTPEPDDAPPPAGPPPTHLVWAVLVTLCCCLPGGIAAIVCGARVSGRWLAGDYVGSWEASRYALMWCVLGTLIGLPLSVVLLILQMQQALEQGG